MESTALPPADHNQLATRYPGFSSFKTRTAIHYRQRWLRDALIQTTLDPHTIELAPSSTPEADLPRPIEFAFRRRTAAGFGLVLVSQVETDIGDAINDDQLTVVTRNELNREPVLTASRTIWSTKRVSVDGAERYRVIETVDRSGSAMMHEAIGAVKDLRVDPFLQVCSLLANSYLSTDLRTALGPDSVLTLGPATAADVDEPWFVGEAFAQW